MNKKPLMLIILDGLGIGKEYEGNAVFNANTPVLDNLIKNYPYTEIEASGLSVGLPEGQMGNSEVGHLNIGSGRIIYQELTNISKSIETEEFFKKQELLAAIENAKLNNTKIHLMGLLSPGGVHSHNTHIYGMLELMKRENFKDVYVHAIMDGRDVPPRSAYEDIKELEEKMKDLGVGKIATVVGRYYAMDRDNRWDRIQLAYDAYTLGSGNENTKAAEAVKQSYVKEINDEFILPTVITEDGEPIALVEDDDSVIFCNFRPDRSRQITRAFVDDDFKGFKRDKIVNTFYVTMTEYDKTIENVHVVFKPEQPKNNLGEIISENGLNQLRAAETEKYAHVTFFFNGGKETNFKNEDRLLVPSPNVATYDLEPEMNAMELKNEIIDSLYKDKYDFIVLNFANCDMVGHTGKIPETVKAVETVDFCLGEILQTLEEKGGEALVTSDHGNAEKLMDFDDGSVITSHTTNKVPLIYFTEKIVELENKGKLADLAPTILEILDIEQPGEMTGTSLIKK